MKLLEGDFLVKSSDGKKLEDVENLERIRKSLTEAIDGGGEEISIETEIFGRKESAKRRRCWD